MKCQPSQSTQILATATRVSSGESVRDHFASQSKSIDEPAGQRMIKMNRRRQLSDEAPQEIARADVSQFMGQRGSQLGFAP